MLAGAACIAALLPSTAGAARPDEVDPLIGTAWEGNTLPGANVPFGFAAPGPDTCDLQSGYCPDQPIRGFSQTHISGTGGASRYGNFRLVPHVGEASLTPPAADWEGERAVPGYYAVRLIQPGVRAEMTAARLAALYRLTYPRTPRAHLAVDASSVLKSGGRDGQQVERVSAEITGARSFAGTATIGWGHDERYTLHFAAELDRRPRRLALQGARSPLAGRAARRGAGSKLGVVATFDTRARRRVRMRIGLSFVSRERAARNLRALPRFDFDAARAKADKRWRKPLGTIDVEGGSPADRRIFATALFHAHSMPHDLSGDNGWWRSREPHFQDFYTLWDTFRTVNPLISVIDPRTAGRTVRSLIDTYEHTGWLPDALLAGTSGPTQVGTSADVVLADAVAKDLPGVDPRRAYRAVRKNAERTSRRHWKHGRQLDQYKRLGYVPIEQRASASRTVEYAYGDYAVAQVARAAGDPSAADRYLVRARNWANLWDPATQSIRPRHADGSFVREHYPSLAYFGWNDAFYEASARIVATFVPHDTQSLIRRLGGDDGFVRWLDGVMAHDYEPRNEPSLLAPYLFIHAGRHDRTAAHVREVLEREYGTDRGGVPGNDDAGTLSAWYAWGAIGLYPNAGQPYYYIGSPIFTRTRIATRRGTFTIAAPGASRANKFVTAATLNGEPLERAFITHSELARGGALRLEMSRTPNGWGSAVRPPSLPAR